MTRITRLLSVLALGLTLSASAVVAHDRPLDSAQDRQQIDDLRRRVEEVERQLFQQRLATPANPQSPAVDRLQARLDQLERELSSERVSRMAATISAPKTARGTAGEEKTLEGRITELEVQREADAKTIAALVKRIEKLEKPVAKPKVVK
ncbi:MAG: hypothetical protein WD690_13495 [Vicinamibacterales bacterium]